MITVTDTAWIQQLLDWVIPSRETDFLETKRVSGKMVSKALETVCAFANTNGGWLVLGVEDFTKAQGAQRLYGVAENAESVDELIRKLNTHILPVVSGVSIYRVPCVLRDGAPGALVVLYVTPSDKVHSILDDGTWTRLSASNREMSASEITELSYRRGVRSAESEPVDLDFELLDTEIWRLYLRGRGLSATGLCDQLYRVGLAKKVGGELKPVRAAVLLFADQPGALLASTGTRADVRVFHYTGNAVKAGEVPNLKKAPKTLSGPLHRLIQRTHAYVLDELAGGLTMAASGFRTVHRYPERVVKEAITNALIHRDYRMNRDVQIRIFDNHVEVTSPGLFPGRISAATVSKMGSYARNALIASSLREFPEAPNVDAGEGVPMMFNLMRVGNLYPPQYREHHDQSQQAITVTLLNEERPPVWEQVSDWMDRQGPIANSDLCHIAGLDTLKASKMLKRWVEQGLLVSDPTRGKRNMVYRKTVSSGEPMGSDLLAGRPDNKLPNP